MIKLLIVLIISLCLLSTCTTDQVDLRKEAKEEIVNADKAMNELATTKGFYYSLLKYADASVIMPKEGELPIAGREVLEKHWSDKSEIKQIAWVPIIAEASASGDLGYTFGNWKFTSKDTTFYGNYCTIWKKQKSGEWKFVYDSGNNTPKP